MEEAFSGLGNSTNFDNRVLQTFRRSFIQVQNILDQNRLLISEINQNHESKIPDNLGRNVGLIRELNNNIRRVVDLYSDLSNSFAKSMDANSSEGDSSDVRSDGKAVRKRIRPGSITVAGCNENLETWSMVGNFVADGVFFAELNEVLTRELAEDGYSGVEVRVTPMRTEIIIRATRTQNVLGEKGRRIRELTSVVQKRFKFPEGNVELYAEKVNNRGLCAIAQAESLRYKLLGGLAVRRACYGVLRFVMESGAKGCEVIVSGKLRAQRAKSMKFKDGYMISSGQPVNEYIDSAVRHVLLRQGVLGIKVKIMLDWDPKGKQGPTTPLPDVVTIHTPKEEEDYVHRPAIQPMATEVEQPPIMI
ncbi:hypothetical protein RHMOL_Rhmol05G0011800 [Rhododendron molle]|uniref:Uncharacterized protein n=1 Tax=Rhododendron molle TaxID=49168 RepID=A0ACC0NKI2_RHOML|nr:hypothetical protein RHMOL_Rhmol05G0011800 [Rhododendron molle]